MTSYIVAKCLNAITGFVCDSIVIATYGVMHRFLLQII